MKLAASNDKELQERWLSQFVIAVVIPCHRVERQIERVLRSIPCYVRHIVAVNDASPDDTQAVLERVASDDPRIILVRHRSNHGVGGAMVSGFKKALELGAQVVVKMDGDGQMSAEDLPGLLAPLIRGEADYAKGNRFRDFQALRRMPLLRRVGNMGLSFLVKAATGYWNCFDPCNGFVAIRGDVLAQIPLDNVHRSYFFETSMLGNLGLLNAVVRDVSLPARYGSEVSSLSLPRVLFEFPPRLAALLCKRLFLKNFVYDFNLESVQLMFGLPMLLAGAAYGVSNWIYYGSRGQGAPTGTVVIPALLIILGFQLLLAAIGLDLQATPRIPICGGPLGEVEEPSGARGHSQMSV
jgi:glycosyltransferase involved in cell wall biosynthesis